ncbi:MAG: hypothetical protein EOP84_07130, partial [Verrucomicrobiaceae bacterium]
MRYRSTDLVESAQHKYGMPSHADDLTDFAETTRVELGLKQFWLTLVDERIRLNLILVSEDRRGHGLGSQA